MTVIGDSARHKATGYRKKDQNQQKNGAEMGLFPALLRDATKRPETFGDLLTIRAMMRKLNISK